MRLPTWEELVRVEEQLEVLEHPLDQSLFVVGPPGSGKTVLAVYRAQMVAEAEAAQTEAAQPIAIVTFSRMLRRLLALLDEAGNTYAKTMHSFVWHDYRDRISMNPPSHTDDQYTCQLHKIPPHTCVHCTKYGTFRPKQRVAHVHCQ